MVPYPAEKSSRQEEDNMAKPKDVTDSTFEQDVLKASNPVLVDCGRDSESLHGLRTAVVEPEGAKLGRG